MLNDFAVTRRTAGLVASLDDDRVFPVGEDGADPEGVGGGSPPPDDDAHLDAEGGAGDDLAGTEPPADRRTDADDPDDEEFDVDETDESGRTLTVEERIKKLASALKRAKRKLSTSRAGRQRLKELSDRGIHLDDLIVSHRNYHQLVELSRRNPEVRRLLSGDVGNDDPPARSADRRPAADPEPEFTFDESPEALGFDPNESRTNRVLADGLKRAAKSEFLLERALKRIEQLESLAPKVEGLDRTIRTESQQRIAREWDTVTAAAAAKIKDEGHRTIFQDLMLSAREKVGGRRAAADIAKHYLSKMGIDAGTAQRAGAAATAAGAAGRRRHETAERVASLPRPGQGGSPAPARKSNERLVDVRRRLTGAQR